MEAEGHVKAAAKKQVNGQALQIDMEKRGIYVKASSMPGLAEEQGWHTKILTM